MGSVLADFTARALLPLTAIVLQQTSCKSPDFRLPPVGFAAQTVPTRRYGPAVLLSCEKQQVPVLRRVQGLTLLLKIGVQTICIAL